MNAINQIHHLTASDFPSYGCSVTLYLCWKPGGGCTVAATGATWTGEVCMEACLSLHELRSLWYRLRIDPRSVWAAAGSWLVFWFHVVVLLYSWSEPIRHIIIGTLFCSPPVVVSIYCVRMDFLRVVDIVVVILWVCLIGLPLDRNWK
jgi:hypothetical protein